jgi:hypothetical protein
MRLNVATASSPVIPPRSRIRSAHSPIGTALGPGTGWAKSAVAAHSLWLAAVGVFLLL